jgi:membrane-bound metal-dependent hydrolase YbcI (DUF457 family)
MGASLYADRPADRRNWLELVAFVFFANAPDLDFIPGLLMGEPHLFHRGMSHSLLFAAMVAVSVRLLCWHLGSEKAGRWARIVFFAMLSHIALDYFCAPVVAEGPMLFWPFTPLRIAHSPSLFPLFSHSHIISWGNVLAAVGEACMVGIIFMIAVVRRAMTENIRLDTAARENPESQGLEEVSE